MSNESRVLVYGTNLGGYRAAYALCKKGYEVVLLNRGAYVDEIRNQTLSQLPLDFCWMCGHFPQRLFKALGCIQDFYNAELVEVSGQAGNFTVKFTTTPQIVNNFACTECDQCIEVCPVDVGERKAIYVHPEIGWENIYLIDRDHCTKCMKCEEVCPTGALRIERDRETKEVKVGAIILATEFEEPEDEELADFGLGKSPCVIRNSEISRRSLGTNFVRDSVSLPSGKVPERFAIVVTPHFNSSITEHESYNLCVSAVNRAVKLMELFPEAEVHVFLRDYKGFGKRQFRWYKKALDAGVEINRVESLKVDPGDGERVTVGYEENGAEKKWDADLAILVTGQKAPSLMQNLSEMCGVKADEVGFCNTKEFSCSETDVDGIFAVGELTGAKGNPEAIWEGCATLTETLKYLGDPIFKPPGPPSLRSVKGQEPEVGVFICSCFGKFEKDMELERLRDRVAELSGIKHAEVIKGCCTPDTIKETSERIKDSGVNRVVLAVCTPIQKLLKFRKAVMGAGLNPLLSEFLRLREDVINVHTDKDKMNDKAFTLIRAAAEKVKRGTQSPTLTESFLPSAMVIGGGLAGLTSALDIAENGFPVTLVEREETLGGNPVGFTKEQNEYLSELIRKVEGRQDITVYTSAELVSSEGHAGNFHVVIEKNGESHRIDCGVIVLATGADEYQPSGFLYGEDERVVGRSQLQSRIEEGAVGDRVAFIQCVGSRDHEHPYCSRVCCNEALRDAATLAGSGKKITIFYRDMTDLGKEDLLERAVSAGVKFIRFEEGSYPEVKKTGTALEVTTTGGETEEADLVVLSTGIVPNVLNNRRLSDALGYPLDQDGFFDTDVNVYPYEESMKRLFKPYEWATNCIFPVGLAHSPRSFEESILTARDAAGRALILLGKGKLPAPNAMYIAEVKESLCMGCGICVDVCPYSARAINIRDKVAVVHPFLCDSCGSCVAVCPNDASYLRDLTGDQIMASIDALLA
jgi:heterodisulfide reductase subunit A